MIKINILYNLLIFNILYFIDNQMINHNDITRDNNKIITVPNKKTI